MSLDPCLFDQLRVVLGGLIVIELPMRRRPGDRAGRPVHRVGAEHQLDLVGQVSGLVGRAEHSDPEFPHTCLLLAYRLRSCIHVRDCDDGGVERHQGSTWFGTAVSRVRVRGPPCSLPELLAVAQGVEPPVRRDVAEVAAVHVNDCRCEVVGQSRGDINDV
ncbi:hypothetical protein Ae505Ps2_0010c [Pseudonocardia sp. Ae505_Ps2]|nr:hypothetical protein Ae505Ps2_0010c [Pseudonocardia sp. Ae505_Ps2]